MASLKASPASVVSISETFGRLRKQGSAAFMLFITAGGLDLSATTEALKVLDSYMIELDVPSSDPWADGSVLQTAAMQALVKDVGVHGLVVPNVSLEGIEILRKEATKNNIELVPLMTLTTPKYRMEAIADASQGFICPVSSTDVIGAHTSVSLSVQTLSYDIKEAIGKFVVVGFCISKIEHMSQISAWEANDVIVGGAMVKKLAEARSPEGLKNFDIFTKSLKAHLSHFL